MKEGFEKADPSQFELLKVLGQGSYGKVSPSLSPSEGVAFPCSWPPAPPTPGLQTKVLECLVTAEVAGMPPEHQGSVAPRPMG